MTGKEDIMKHGESGRSIIEMIGVLAIIGILTVGGIAGFSRAMTRNKINKTIDQVQTLTTNMRSLFASQRKTLELSGAEAYKLGLLTDETWNGTRTTNPFGGEINFGKGSISGQTERSFTIEYTGLPTDACVSIATAEWGADSSSGLIRMWIGTGVSAQLFSWTSATNPLPIEAVTAIEKCSVNGGTIKWEYR